MEDASKDTSVPALQPILIKHAFDPCASPNLDKILVTSFAGSII